MPGQANRILHPATVKSIRRKLLAWYHRNRRPLPWRTRPSPYGTVLSEFMLQQTQVATVIPYYQRFLKQFPGFHALADADESDVLKAWAGLGYYKRAINLKKTAERIVHVYRGKLPNNPDELRKLPGFGEYTTGAVGSIALDLPLTLMDGNVRRVVGRLFTLWGDLTTGDGKKQIQNLCVEILDMEHPGDFNQALMELGALICLPRNPDCGQCPLKTSCMAHRSGRPEGWPEPVGRPSLRKVQEIALAVFRNRRLLVLQRPNNTSFPGLWELPRMDDRRSGGNDMPTPHQVLDDLINIHTNGRDISELGRSRSIFTHHLIDTTLFGIPLRPRVRIRRSFHIHHQWVKINGLDELPSSNAQKKLFELARNSGLVR